MNLHFSFQSVCTDGNISHTDTRTHMEPNGNCTILKHLQNAVATQWPRRFRRPFSPNFRHKDTYPSVASLRLVLVMCTPHHSIFRPMLCPPVRERSPHSLHTVLRDGSGLCFVVVLRFGFRFYFHINLFSTSLCWTCLLQV